MAAVNEQLGRIVEAVTLPFADVSRGYTFFAEGDVLFAKITPCMQNGKHAVAIGLIDGIGFGSTEFHVLRPSDLTISDWLHYFVRQPAFLRQAERWLTGAVGQQRLPEDYLADALVPLPPLSEQRRIAARLKDQLAAVEEARTAATDAAKQPPALVEAILRESFHRITPLSLAVQSDPAPPGWAWQRLTSLARLETGHTPSRNCPEYWKDGDIPWLALPDIRALDCRVATTTAQRTNKLGLANSAARLLPAQTVCLSRTASVGFITIMGVPMATSQDFVNWVCGDQITPEFLMWLLRASRKFIHSVSTGAIHKTVYMHTVERFHVCIPSLSEQQRIARTLTDRIGEARRLESALAAQRAELDALPNALLREAFSGAA